MRVLQVGLSENIGGIETFVMSYFRELIYYGVTFDFLDIYGNGLAFADEIVALGGKIYTMPNYKKHPFKFMREMKRVLCENNYTCIHMNMLSAANLLPLKVTLKCGNIPIVHSHNSGTEGLIRTLMHKLNLKKLRKSTELRLSCGENAGKWMFGKYEFQVIPNAVNVGKFAFNAEQRVKIRAEIGIAEDTFLLGFVGRLSHQKNPKFLADILLSVKECLNRPVKLAIVGDGELKQEVISRATELNVINDMFFAGIRKDIGAWYSAMDCLLLPSLYEGFVIVAVEAQASGLPCCVSTFVPYETKITKLVEFLPLENDTKCWGNCIANIANRNEMRQTDLLNNSVYDIKVSAEKLFNIYNDCTVCK